MTATEAPQQKPWQQGCDLEWLKSVASQFKAEEPGRIIGRFVGIDERWVAERGNVDAGDRLRATADGYIGLRVAKTSTGWKAHGNRTLPSILPGDIVIERFCGTAKAAAATVELFEDKITAMLSPLPHPEADRLADILGLHYVGSKIPAGGEIIGMWHRYPQQPPPGRDRPEALNFVGPLTSVDTAGLLSDLEATDMEWVQHYSGYNKRRTWTALSLRGFGPGLADVEKPAEMSKGWKAEHPGWQTIACVDTPLRAQLPSVEPILAAIGAHAPERVRLMRLEAGHGELSRHADITDKDAGLRPGELARIHIPLKTNDGVVFSGWRLETGTEEHAHMAVGEAWALEHTKPHAAANKGGTERIHLVVDTPVAGLTAELLQAAAAAGG